MKVLIDNNLSHRLVEKLSDLFPGSTHVMMEDLDESDDQEIWNFAKQYGFTIVTKDSDYNDLSVIEGSPPKVIWLRIGNCKVPEIEKIIREHFEILDRFIDDKNSSIIEID
ncbi:MAG: hypothetical protein GY866_26340 [Proteobacteria bacterium]|nr:hypothetical protein [Pseudomonadota bacterium]